MTKDFFSTSLKIVGTHVLSPNQILLETLKLTSETDYKIKLYYTV